MCAYGPRLRKDLNPSGTAISSTSGDNFLDYPAAHIRQAKLTPLKEVRQFLVVDAQQVQDGRLQVMDMNATLYDVEAVVIRTAIDMTALHATSCHPQGEDSAVVIATVAV